MENYERKYKEALRWMQGLYSGLHGATKEEAEHYFPELKEKESERIRKDIISYLRNEKIVKRYISDIEVDKWIAWLEKLGKGKSVLEAWKDMRLEVYQQASGNRHEPNYSDDSTKMFSLNDIDEIIEKISEQSHNDKTEPKALYADNVIAWLVANICHFEYYVELFKKDFGLC